MEWIDYLRAVADRREPVDGIHGDNPLSEGERNALLAVFPTQYQIRSFVEAGKSIHRSGKTLTTQFQSIYNKFTIEPATPEELAIRLRIGFEKIPKEDPQSQIDWRTACMELLEIQKEQLTSSPIRQGKAKHLDLVHVPLGLVERQEKQRPKFDREQEFLPDRGSEAYHQVETRIEHDAFLTAVRDRQPGQHLVILGEPGAGKTTLLTKVWESLLAEVDLTEDLIVAWVPLAAVKNGNLEEYLCETWLKQVCKSREKDIYWAAFEKLVDAGRVWLLLDGADEMGGDALMKIEAILKEKWARATVRAIVTCRLNLWDGSPNGLNGLPNFQIYRTLDFKYANPAGEDEVEKFIDNWFEDKAETGKELRLALDATGKERIKDLAQNPLRLTLLCEIWEEKQELPDTQAQLYGQFVDYVYKHNALKFPKAFALREELDRAMGDLAKQGINKPALRFRFSDRELAARLPDIQHRQHIKDLGWLNCVGVDEDDREVYAFFHPTFQEYFAACAIDDWDYFLPIAHIDRPVPCQGEDKPTYRVFEQEWRQVILLWIGRRDEVVTDEPKEEFIDKLTNFREQEGKFYYYRAYCMAAIYVDEFKVSQRTEEIVRQIVKWAFGYSNIDKQEWRTYLNPIESLAKKTIPFTHCGYAIAALIDILNDSNYDDLSSRVEATEALGQIAIGNTTAIAALIDLLHDHNCHDWLRFAVAEALGKIDPGNSDAIEALIDVFCSRRSRDSIGGEMVKALVQIAPGNSEAIAALIDLLHNDPDCEDYDRCHVAEALGLIDPGNPTAFEALIDFFYDPNCDGRLRWIASEALGLIDPGNPTAIAVLINLVLDPKCDSRFRSGAAEVLGRFDPGNPTALKVLIDLVLDPNLPWGRSEQVYSLGLIAVGNQDAIAALIDLVLDPNGEARTRSKAAEALNSILFKTTMPSAIWQLKNNLANEVYDTMFKGCSCSYFVLFHCAQTLPYQEFHTAWHQTHLPTNPFSPQTLHQQLNRPNTIILDITTLNHHTTPELAQELSNRIHNHLNTQPIPQIQNIPQLKSELLNLKPHLALILYHPTPTPTLIQEIAKLHTPKQIQHVWLTTADNVPDALPPEQENLVAAIWSAIDRFTE